ncbi:hypothetical protein NEUTE2DRAFT_51490, partial [Neurospora tetrasperma FGSC 2509]
DYWLCWTRRGEEEVSQHLLRYVVHPKPSSLSRVFVYLYPMIAIDRDIHEDCK